MKQNKKTEAIIRLLSISTVYVCYIFTLRMCTILL